MGAVAGKELDGTEVEERLKGWNEGAVEIFEGDAVQEEADRADQDERQGQK